MHLFVKDFGIYGWDPLLPCICAHDGHAVDVLASCCGLALTILQSRQLLDLFKQCGLSLIKLVEAYCAAHQKGDQAVHLHRVVH